MKRFLCVICFCAAAGIAARAASFSATSGFGPTNPSGPWSYGTAGPGDLGNLDATFTAMPTFVANCSSGGGFSADCWVGGDAVVARPTGTFGTGSVQYTAGYVNLHPASALNMAVLAFVAPSAGLYDFSGEFRDHDTAGGSGVRFSAALGDGTLLSDTIAGAVFSPVAFNFSQSLAAGQRVYFALGAQGDFSFDSVGLNLAVRDQAGAAVPEPGSLVLVPLGAAALWALRRRR